jgi:hypothetical protein
VKDAGMGKKFPKRMIIQALALAVYGWILGQDQGNQADLIF